MRSLNYCYFYVDVKWGQGHKMAATKLRLWAVGCMGSAVHFADLRSPWLERSLLEASHQASYQTSGLPWCQLTHSGSPVNEEKKIMVASHPTTWSQGSSTGSQVLRDGFHSSCRAATLRPRHLLSLPPLACRCPTLWGCVSRTASTTPFRSHDSRPLPRA